MIDKNTAAYLIHGKEAQGKTAMEVMANANLDFKVDLSPIFTPGRKRIRDRFQRVYRTDNDETLGIVSPIYKPLQNAEMFGVADSLVREGDIAWDRVASSDLGERVMASFVLPDTFTIGSNDTFNKYIYLITSHDGSACFRVIPTNMRLFCTNQFPALVAALKRAGIDPRLLSIRHSGRMGERIDQLRKIINLTDRFSKNFAQQAEKLLRVAVSKERRVKYYIHAMGFKTDAKAKTHPYGLSDRNLGALNAILDLEKDDTNTANGMTGTAWGMFNVLTGYIDHEWTHNSKGFINPKRVESALIGTGAHTKARAWENVLDMAA